MWENWNVLNKLECMLVIQKYSTEKMKISPEGFGFKMKYFLEAPMVMLGLVHSGRFRAL